MKKVLAAAFLVLCASAAAGQRAEYVQSPAVASRYVDVPLETRTPAFAPGKTGFTTQEEMLAFVQRLAARHPHAVARTLGYSEEQREIPLLIFTAEGYSTPAEITRLNRPIVWLIGGQHGDEPAGGEAMLAAIQLLAEGDWKPLLDRITVIVVPRANPDGAHHNKRTTARNVDLNRDHLALSLPETQALHAAMMDYPPDVVGDFHEFNVVGSWLERLRVVQAVDLMMLYSTHPLVPKPVIELADRSFRPAIERALNSNRLSHFWYFTSGYQAEQNLVQLGGTQPGIARNRFGLGGAVSFLFETRGVGIGRQNLGRRVAAHLTAARALLQVAADEAPRLRSRLQQARAELLRNAAKGQDMTVTFEAPRENWSLPMLDPETGQAREIKVSLENTLAAKPKLLRLRPYAYVLPPGSGHIAKRLMAQGVAVHALTEPVKLDVEAYRVLDKQVKPDLDEGLVRHELSVEPIQRNLAFGLGSYVVPMQQSLAPVVAAALEPEAPGSFANIGLMPVDKPRNGAAPVDVPVYRLMRPTPVPTRLLADPR
jgi:hypothetical protein